MSKIDEVSEAIGELRAEVKSICREIKKGNKEVNTRLDKIEEHLRVQNGRIGKLERFDAKLMGMVIGIPATISTLMLILGFVFNII